MSARQLDTGISRSSSESLAQITQVSAVPAVTRCRSGARAEGEQNSLPVEPMACADQSKLRPANAVTVRHSLPRYCPYFVFTTTLKGRS